MKKIALSIVIPAYNEEKNLRKGVLDHLFAYLDDVKYSYEVIVVDDASSDDTALLVEEYAKKKPTVRFIRNEHGGKAITVMTGLLEAKGEVVVFTDMDQATPIREVERFFPKFEEGFDVVIGSRMGRKGAPMLRKLSAVGFAVLRNLILGLPYKDTQCGFKGFTNGAVKEIFPGLLAEWREKSKPSGGAVNAGFDVEVLFIARQKGLKIAEVDVEWHYVDTERVQVVRDAFQAVKDMVRIRANSLSGKYS